MIRFYADPEFGRAFRYDQEDILRARRNEALAAQNGLQAKIEHPLSGKSVGMRPFLGWLLDELKPLAQALDLWQDLAPLQDMAAGGSNTAGVLRAQVMDHMGTAWGGDEVKIPAEMLKELAEQRERQVAQEIEEIASSRVSHSPDQARLDDLLQRARDDAHHHPQAPIRFRPASQARISLRYPDKTSEILALAEQLIRIPSVTASPSERLDEVHRAATLIFDYVRDSGLEVRFYDQNKYPALLIGLPGSMHAPVMLCGHFDVVEPEPDERQFEPRVEGDYLWGRGAADMKTVVATYLIWLKDQLRRGAPYPAINLLLVGNEENGEIEPMGTPHVLRGLAEVDEYTPSLLIAGERTGEKGVELWGEICTQNRGVIRLEISAYGERAHSGVATVPASGRAKAQPPADLTERLLLARAGITGIMGRYLTLSSPDGWQSQVKFPFIQIGRPGIFNITPDHGVLGVEVRPIPQDDLPGMLAEIQLYCSSLGLELNTVVMEKGIECTPNNPYLKALTSAVEHASGSGVVIGRKLPGTSARFAPGGQGVVWGQSGIGPHARNESHFIPSILPYYQALDAYADLLRR
jgi:acetylornithine deacetylase/succinyl-diaminopimelate desuccinylase-like protein